MCVQRSDPYFSHSVIVLSLFQPAREEAERINRTNIVICTPGRLLQHMDETVAFHADNLLMLGMSLKTGNHTQ